ncbi:MAG: hypothetical protein IKB73_01535 [Ruminococcus sp.]|nr:hypothetical protein [Ruminococcus sp.]
MRKKTLVNIFLVTFCVTLLCVLVIMATEYIATGDITHIWAYYCSMVIIPSVVTCFVMRAVKVSIIDPINDIDIENPDTNELYKEFSPLMDKINSQNSRILQQMEELKYESQNKDRLRREFTANVSHELKTPLTSISGYAEIMRDGIARPEDIKRFSGKIYDESGRLITLVEDIIKLSQLEESNVKINDESIDLYTLCDSVITRLESIAKKRNITFSLIGDKCHINGVYKIIEEMVYNLCDNALKYNKENGDVTVTIRQCVDGVELSVSDSGIGIPKDDIPRIFERFYRVNKSHSKEIGGTGLGLSIVKHGALYHNASITVDSELNKGTTIKILF